MPRTYRELQEFLSTMTAEQLDKDITIYLSHMDEYHAVAEDYPFIITDVADVLDANHPYLAV